MGAQERCEPVERLVRSDSCRIQVGHHDHIHVRLFLAEGTGSRRTSIAALQKIRDIDWSEARVIPDPLPERVMPGTESIKLVLSRADLTQESREVQRQFHPRPLSEVTT